MRIMRSFSMFFVAALTTQLVPAAVAAVTVSSAKTLVRSAKAEVGVTTSGEIADTVSKENLFKSSIKSTKVAMGVGISGEATNTFNKKTLVKSLVQSTKLAMGVGTSGEISAADSDVSELEGGRRRSSRRRKSSRRRSPPRRRFWTPRRRSSPPRRRSGPVRSGDPCKYSQRRRSQCPGVLPDPDQCDAGAGVILTRYNRRRYERCLNWQKFKDTTHHCDRETCEKFCECCQNNLDKVGCKCDKEYPFVQMLKCMENVRDVCGQASGCPYQILKNIAVYGNSRQTLKIPCNSVYQALLENTSLAEHNDLGSAHDRAMMGGMSQGRLDSTLQAKCGD